jgi:hypothetical protein
MVKTKIIRNVNKKVIDFIKAKVSAKKERHEKLLKSVKPEIIQGLKKMKKVEC